MSWSCTRTGSHGGMIARDRSPHDEAPPDDDSARSKSHDEVPPDDDSARSNSHDEVFDKCPRVWFLGRTVTGNLNVFYEGDGVVDPRERERFSMGENHNGW